MRKDMGKGASLVRSMTTDCGVEPARAVGIATA